MHSWSAAAPRTVSPRAVWMCVLLALAAWAPSIVRGGVALDDVEVVERNPVVLGRVPWTEAFRRDTWEHLSRAGHFRPLATLSLRLDRALYGGDWRGFHATNVALHVACVLAAGLLLVMLAAPRWSAFGLAFFAVHPALADSVAWVSGRTSMLSGLSGLLGALLLAAWTIPAREFTPGRAVRVAAASAAGLAPALLAKEDGIAFAPLYVALAALHARKTVAAAACGCALGVASYLALRGGALGSPWPSAEYAPLAHVPLLERLSVGGRALLEAARITAVPLDYPPIYERAAMFEPGALRTTLGLAGCAALALVAIASAVLWRRRPRSLAACSALLASLAVLPWIQIVPAGALFAPRFLYLPLLLAIPALSACAQAVFERRARFVSVLWIAALLVGAWDRSRIYASRGAYYAAQLACEPRDAPAHNELGLWHEDRGELARARELFERSAALDPTYGRPWSNLGRLELDAGRLDEAERALTRAVELGKGNATAYVNLGIVLTRRGRAAEALAHLERASRLAPGLVPAWRARARAELDLGRNAEARSSIDRARELDPLDERTLALQREIEARAAQR